MPYGVKNKNTGLTLEDLLEKDGKDGDSDQ